MNNNEDPIIIKYKLLEKKKDVLIKFETDLSNEIHLKSLNELDENISSEKLKNILQEFINSNEIKNKPFKEEEEYIHNKNH